MACRVPDQIQLKKDYLMPYVANKAPWWTALGLTNPQDTEITITFNAYGNGIKKGLVQLKLKPNEKWVGLLSELFEAQDYASLRYITINGTDEFWGMALVGSTQFDDMAMVPLEDVMGSQNLHFEGNFLSLGNDWNGYAAINHSGLQQQMNFKGYRGDGLLLFEQDIALPAYAGLIVEAINKSDGIRYSIDNGSNWFSLGNHGGELKSLMVSSDDTVLHGYHFVGDLVNRSSLEILPPTVEKEEWMLIDPLLNSEIGMYNHNGENIDIMVTFINDDGVETGTQQINITQKSSYVLTIGQKGGRISIKTPEGKPIILAALSSNETGAMERLLSEN